jgi:hypothetical protein
MFLLKLMVLLLIGLNLLLFDILLSHISFLLGNFSFNDLHSLPGDVDLDQSEVSLNSNSNFNLNSNPGSGSGPEGETAGSSFEKERSLALELSKKTELIDAATKAEENSTCCAIEAAEANIEAAQALEELKEGGTPSADQLRAIATADKAKDLSEAAEAAAYEA